MEQDKSFLEYVVKALVDNPSDVKIDRKVDEMGVLITMTVNPAASASSHSQSTHPSSSTEICCGRMKLQHNPCMPDCRHQFTNTPRPLGSSVSSRPIAAKRSGCNRAASSTTSWRSASQYGGTSTARRTPAASISRSSSSAPNSASLCGFCPDRHGRSGVLGPQM